ncbi:ATPase, partial [Bacillus thuringiensis]|nr:ATPase [Bacillus thuringiensis]
FNVNSNASTFATLSLVHPALGQAFEYEVQIVPNQPGGLYSVYGLTADSVIITAQRIVNSELTQFL